MVQNREKTTWIKILPPIALSFLATLVNPFGFDLWSFLLRHLFEGRPEITEWRPLAITSLQGVLYLAWLALCALGLAFSRKGKSPAFVAILCLTAVMPLISFRHLMFFQLTALLVAGSHLGSALQRLAASADPARPVRRWLLLIPLLAAFLLLLMRPPNLKTIPFPEGFDYPLGAVQLMAEAGIQGNLAVDYNWGHYVSWHLSPQVLVSVDTRREMAYPDEAYQASLRFMTGYGAWDNLLEAYPTDLALVERGTPPANLLSLHPDWELVFQDEASLLFARRGSGQASLLKSAARDFQAVENGIFP